MHQLPNSISEKGKGVGTQGNVPSTERPNCLLKNTRLGFTPILQSLGLAVMLLLLLPQMGWAQIAAWDFFGQSSPATFAATTFNANLVSTSNASNITRGAGASVSSGSNSFRTQGFQNNGIATTNTDYFQITLQASAGYKVSLSTIDARFVGTSTYYANAGVTSQFAYSLNGSSFTLIGSPVTSPSLTMTQVDLSGISALQNVTAGTTITLRYYASGQTNTGGWGFSSPTAGTNGLAIGGSVVSTAPTISTAGVPSAVSTTYGTASTNTSFNVSGSNLTEGIGIAAPAGFEVSTDAGSGYAPTITVGTAPSVAATPIFVRLASNTTPGNYSGNIVLSSAGATSVNVATATSTVSPKELIINGLTADNKAYDGLTTATLMGTAALVGVVNGDDVSLSGTPSANFTSADAGTGKTVTVTGYTLAGTNATNYTAAQPTGLTADITPAAQTITFGALADKTEGDAPFALTATASSGLTVTYVSSNTAVATVSGSTVTVLAAGTTDITASQAGNVNYQAASNMVQTLTVMSNGKTNQTITFGTLSNVTYGDADFELTATASSGLEIFYESSNPAIATIAGSTVTITGAGTVTITATQPGDPTYNAAPAVQQSLTVLPKPVAIVGITANNKTYDGTTAATLSGTPALNGFEMGDDVSVTGTPVANFADANVGTAKSVTVMGYTIGGADAANYSIVQPMGLTADITKANQTITFGALPQQIVGAPSFFLTATASSGLAVTYTSSNTDVASVSGNTVSIIAAGTTIITASQAGDDNYNPATDVQQTQIIATTLALWNFQTVSSIAPPMSNVTVSNWSSGNNFGSPAMLSISSPSNGYPSASGNSNAGAAAYTGALNTATSTYFEFTLTPSPAYYIEITGLFYGSRSTGTGPLQYTLRSSADNYSTNIATGNYFNNGAWLPFVQSNLSAVTATATPTTFRLYGHSGTGSPTSGTTNWRVDDFTVLGLVHCATPAAYTVTGGGTICSVGPGTAVGLNNSQLGINYQLKIDGANIGMPVAGTGSAISFGLQTTAGTYTVEGSNTNGDCNLSTSMISNAVISVTPASTYYADNDMDGFGATTVMACTQPAGTVTNNTDCNDNDNSVNTPQQYYVDADLDTYGSTATAMVCASTAPSGYSTNNTDCNDSDMAVHATQQYYVDGDLDGFGSTTLDMLCSLSAPSGYSTNNTDCDDNQNAINTPQQYFVDADLDTYGSTATAMVCAVSAPAGYATNNTDCNDANGSVNATQQYYVDADLDAYGSTATAMVCASAAPSGYSTNNTDCNDGDNSVNTPQQYYVDTDLDTYGSTATAMVCSAVPTAGYSSNSTDCNDNDNAVNTPQQYYVDADLDAYGSTTTAMVCSAVATSGYSTNDTDCNDNDNAVNTPQQYFVDTDLDTYGSTTTAMLCSAVAPIGYSSNDSDCDDNNAAVNPAAIEAANTYDDDCDGIIDEALSAIASVVSHAACAGAFGTVNVMVSDGPGPYTYLWSNGATTATNNTALAGPHSVTITDANSTVATSNVTVTEPTLTITCPANVTINTTSTTTACNLLVPASNIGAPTLTGACVGAMPINSFTNSSDPTGTYPVSATLASATMLTWTMATATQTQTCTQRIWVKDMTAPKMNCLNNQTKVVGNVNVAYPTGISDNCGFLKLQVRRRTNASGAQYTPYYDIPGGTTPSGAMPFNSNGAYPTGQGSWVLQYRGVDVNNNYKVCQFTLNVTATSPTPETLDAWMPEPQSWEVLAGEAEPIELVADAQDDLIHAQPFEMSVYPNPNEGRCWVTLENLQSEMVVINIFDQVGRQVQHNPVIAFGKSATVALDLNTLPNGVFFIQVKAGAQTRLEKVVKL